MRIIAEIPSSEYKITVYHWNNKYLIKFEKGNYEQTYKVSEMDLTGEHDIHEIIKDEMFMQEVKQHFSAMNTSFGNVLSKI